MKLPTRIIAIDFETTGLVPMYDYPTSLDAIVFEDGEPTGEAFSVKMAADPKTKISIEAFCVQSGGTDILQDVDGMAKAISRLFPPDGVARGEAMHKFALWAKSVGAFETPNVAHKADFDWAFYEQKMAINSSQYKGTVLSPVWICTKTMARRVIDDRVRHLSLSTVATHLGIEHDKAETHDSRYDAELCGRVYFGLKKAIEEAPIPIPVTTDETSEFAFAKSVQVLQQAIGVDSQE